MADNDGNVGRAVGAGIVGGLLGAATARTGVDTLNPFLKNLREEQKLNKRMADQKAVFRGELNRFGFGREYVDKVFGEGVSVEDAVDLVAGLGPNEFSAQISSVRDEGRKKEQEVETEEEKAELQAARLASIAEELQPFVQDIPERGEDESMDVYLARLEGMAARLRSDVARTEGELGRLTNATAKLVESWELGDPSMWLDGSAAQQAQQDLQRRTGQMRELEDELPGASESAGTWERIGLNAIQRRRDDVAQDHLASQFERGNFVQPTSEDGEPMFGREQYQKAGFDDKMQAARPKYQFARENLAQGRGVKSPAVGDLNKLLLDVNAAENDLQDLSFEDQQRVMEALHRVDMMTLRQTAQDSSNEKSRERVFRKADAIEEALDGQVSLPRTDERFFQIHEGTLQQQQEGITVREYRGLSQEYFLELAERVPQSMISSPLQIDTVVNELRNKSGMSDAEAATLSRAMKARWAESFDLHADDFRPVAVQVRGIDVDGDALAADLRRELVESENRVEFQEVFEGLSSHIGWEGPMPTSTRGREQFRNAVLDAWPAAKASLERRAAASSIGPMGTRRPASSHRKQLRDAQVAFDNLMSREELVETGKAGMSLRTLGSRILDNTVGVVSPEVMGSRKRMIQRDMEQLQSAAEAGPIEQVNDLLRENQSALQEVEAMEVASAAVEQREDVLSMVFKTGLSDMDKKELTKWLRGESGTSTAFGAAVGDEGLPAGGPELISEYQDTEDPVRRIRLLKDFAQRHARTLFSIEGQQGAAIAEIATFLDDDMERVMGMAAQLRAQMPELQTMSRKDVESLFGEEVHERWDEANSTERALMLVARGIEEASL